MTNPYGADFQKTLRSLTEGVSGLARQSALQELNEITLGPSRQLRALTEGLVLPSDSWRALTEGSRVQPEAVRKLSELYAQPVIDTGALKAISDSHRISLEPYRKMLQGIGASSRAAVSGVDIKMPVEQWGKLFQTPQIPVMDWQTVFAPLREALAAAEAEVADAFESEIEAAEEDVAEAPEAPSWLFRLGPATRAALAVAVVQVLDSLEVLYGDLSGNQVPAKLHATINLMFSMLAVLIVLMENASGADGEE